MVCVGLLSVLLGCGPATAPAESPASSFTTIAREIFSANQCGYQIPSAELIKTSSEWASWLARLANSAVAQQWQPEESLLLVVAAGQQPTAGYNLVLRQQTGTHLHFELVRYGQMHAQIITSPCLVVAINQADFNQLEKIVVDYQGERLFVTQAREIRHYGVIRSPRVQ